jgi:hypothetical protein
MNFFFSTDIRNQSQILDRPHQALLNFQCKDLLIKKIKEIGNFELFDGHGGDHLFLASAISASLSDSLLIKGLKKSAEKLFELCILKRISIWSPIQSSIGDLYSFYFHKPYKDCPHEKTYSPWLTEEGKSYLNSTIYRPPFWEDLSKIMPGQAQQISQTYHAIAGCEARLFKVNEITPYLSQPLVLAAYSIPTYDSYNAEGTRIHFRKAISKNFKTDMVWRQMKGEASGTVQRFFMKEADQIKSLCLEGRLVGENFVSKSILENEIDLAISGNLENHWSLLHLISTELWFMSLKGFNHASIY